MKVGYVAIIGRPNVGKSTLLNRFIGEELAIVTPKPQTTRQNIVGIMNRPGAQVVFLDTPGFHESAKALNRYMIEKIGEAITSADVVLLMVDPNPTIPPFSKGGVRGDLAVDEVDMVLFQRCREKNIIIIINKIDTVMSEPWERVVDRYYEMYEGRPTIAISATLGYGCDDLINKIVEMLPEGQPFYPDDQYTEHPTRFLAAEIIREQAMMVLHQELPYSIAVEVTSFKEGADLTRIEANIIIEKDSQKGIVIGAGGEMIKNIGTRAREKIEPLVGTKVFLKLFVKVIKDWTKDSSALKRLLV